MKRIIRLSILMTSIIFTCSCKKLETPYTELTESKEGAEVGIVRKTGSTQILPVFPYQDEARTFSFGASFGALGLPANPINVKYAVDMRALDSLNNIRTQQAMAPYQLFPEEAYSLSSKEAVIPAGQTSSNLVTVSYFSKYFDPLIDYLLPICISSADGYKVARNKTIFLVVNKLTEKAAVKTGWTAEASSEELSGEGSTNGRAAQLIDGNVNTYWHSKWQNGELPFPHTVTVDMKSSIFVTRVDLASRQNYTNGFRRFNLEGSADGNNWEMLGSDLVMDPAIKTFQSYPVSHGYRRYLRLTMTEGYTPTSKSTNLAELTVYGY